MGEINSNQGLIYHGETMDESGSGRDQQALAARECQISNNIFAGYQRYRQNLFGRWISYWQAAKPVIQQISG